MNKRKRVAPHHDKIVELSKTLTLSEISKELNIPVNSLSGYADKHGILLERKNKPIDVHLPRLRELAEQGYHLKQACEIIGIDPASALYQVKKNGISFRNGKYRIENVDEELAVIELFKQGKTYIEISEELGIPNKRVPDYLDKHGIQKRTTVETFRFKHKLNEEAFNRFDTEAETYWFGWLLTDGCITDKHDISIGLKGSDAPILEKFKSFLGSDSEVRVRSYPHKMLGRDVMSASISVRSKVLCEALRSQNLEPRKSCKERLPNFNYKEGNLAAVFWRACLEGDGYISDILKDKKPIARLNLVGSSEVLKGFIEYCTRHCHAPTKEPRRVRNTGNPDFVVVEYAGEYAYRIIKHLWSYGDTFLERKKVRAENIIKFYEDKMK